MTREDPDSMGGASHARSQAVRQLEVQNRVLELLAYGEELSVVLETLVLGIESISPEMLGSIFIYDERTDSLRDPIAPSLPTAYNAALAIVPVGPNVGSCGAAAYRRELVVVSNIAADPLWTDYLGLALPNGLRSCWSQPILSRKGTLLGTFAMYYRTIREPVPEELTVIQGAARLASIAIERKHADAALARARDAALDAARVKSAFLANMSHEIRTPMSGVIGMADLLLQTALDAEQRDFVDTIASSADSLLRILNDILDISKIEAGRLALEEVPIDVRRVVREVGALLHVEAERKGLRLEATVDGRLPERLLGDPVRLRQVLLNLVGNAIKFTSQGGVELRVTTRGTDTGRGATDFERLVFEVEDTGIGIDTATQARLFEPFVQADGSITRRYGGSGLGLSISRALVELMGGELGVESRPGFGSCFRFEIDVRLDTTVELGGLLPEGGLELHGRRFLVAEDNPVNAKVVQHILSRAGAVVDLAANGLEVLDRMSRNAYDAVLMDLQMPDMDGFSATRRIRELEGSTRRTRIIAVSASVLEEQRRDCDEVGMDGWVPKPIRREELFAELARHFTPDSADGEAQAA